MKLFFSESDLKTYVGLNDRWIMLLGIFPLAGVANILFMGTQPNMGYGESFACYSIALVMTICYWIISRYVVISLRMRYRKREQTTRRILLTLSILGVSTFIIAALSMVGLGYLESSLERPEPSLFYKTVMSYTLVLMVIAIYEGVFFFVKYKESLLEQERLAKENMQAQLSVLKQQMNPHFLFNSLNTLVNIIPEDADKATLFTQRLAAVYRRVLEYRHKELIPLAEELDALQDYVFLMQTRFEEKLKIQWCVRDREISPQVHCEDDLVKLCIPSHLRHYRIVPLSIQLLVENAIKHNVISSEHPLLIKIQLDDNVVTISNQLRLRERKLSSTGWGHENLQERYRAITDKEICIKETDNVYTVSIPILSPRLTPQLATG